MVSLQCFGRLTVRFSDTYVSIKCEKARELLGLLAVERGRPMRKEKVAGILWPDSSTRHALDSLYKAIRLIYRLEQDGMRIPIISTRNEVGLEISALKTDIAQFEAFCTEGSIEALEQAVSLYCAPFLADEYYEWTLFYQAFYEIMFAEAIERLLRHFEHCGNLQKQRYYQSLLERP